MLIDHRQERIERARAAERQWRDIRAYGDWLANLQPWAWYTTITFSRPPNREWARTQIKRYLDELEEAAKQPIGWVLVEDHGRVGGRFHFHILIAGVDHVSQRVWWRKAFREFGRADIRVYDESRGAAHYLAHRALGDAGDIDSAGHVYVRAKDGRFSLSNGSWRRRPERS